MPFIVQKTAQETSKPMLSHMMHSRQLAASKTHPQTVFDSNNRLCKRFREDFLWAVTVEVTKFILFTPCISA
jgi:hypothetical protein